MKNKYPDVYRHSYMYARHSDELEPWARSLAENVVCAKAIDRTAKENHPDKDAVRGIIDEYGYERVAWILAATVRVGGHEGHISEQNKVWAVGMEIPAPRTETLDYITEAPPKALDAFITLTCQLRQEQELEEPGPEHNMERLRALPRIIADSTGGKLRCAANSFSGGVYIVAEDTGFFGMDIHKHLDWRNGLCQLQFTGYPRTMGVQLQASGMQEVASQAEQLAALLTRLEQENIIVTEDELSQWAREVTESQPGHTGQKTEQAGPEQSPGLTM